MYESMAAYFWNHWTAFIVGLVVALFMLFLTGTHAALLRWRKQSQEDRDLARESHAGIRVRMGKIDEACKAIPQIEKTLQLLEGRVESLEQSQVLLTNQLTLLLERGPRDIQNLLTEINRRIGSE